MQRTQRIAGAADLERAADALAAQLPLSLSPMARLAYNYRWSWTPGGDDLFRRIDPERFESAADNPVALLRDVPREALERTEHELAPRARELAEELDEELAAPAEGLPPDRPVAFLCAEFGVHRSLRIYSGGLGVLAGDILKGASDARLPMVGVGLLYADGAPRQRIGDGGTQEDFWLPTEPDRLPLARVTDGDGRALLVRVPVEDGEIAAAIWRADVGRVPLYLLDADVPENAPEDRAITARLYVSDPAVRLRQYALLGIGGLRALDAMGIEPGVVHMNEGHAAFAPLEASRAAITAGAPVGEALEAARRRSVFTTHTPVAAGNEGHDPGRVLSILRPLREALGLDEERFLGLVRDGPDEPARMTVLGLRMSGAANAVSARHGEVAREMWRPLYGESGPENVPIQHVTNAVHVPTWIAPELRALLDRHLGEDWPRRATDPETWRGLDAVPDEELWQVRGTLRAALVDESRRRGDGSAHDLSPDALTIGFARRVATYKRLHLLTLEAGRLASFLAGRRVQFLVAGKAHPDDLEAKESLAALLRETADARLVFLEDYDMAIATHLVRGCDVWLNVPRPPMEASGTSGIKSAMNGGLNVSVLDGWWAEAYDGRNGWAIDGELDGDHAAQDARHAGAMLDLLEKEVAPLFHDRDEAGIPRGWLERVRASLATIGPRFGAGRMLDDYRDLLYRPALEA